MKRLGKTEDMTTIELDKGEPLDLHHIGRVEQFMPTLCAVKVDGARDGGPALMFVCEHPFFSTLVIQVSLTTLKPAIKRLLELEKSNDIRKD